MDCFPPILFLQDALLLIYRHFPFIMYVQALQRRVQMKGTDAWII